MKKLENGVVFITPCRCLNFMINDLFEFSALKFVDCGASYFPPDTWSLALSHPSTHLFLVDPNGDNLAYSANLRCKTTTIDKALDATSGLKTLYLANTDSGSSILPPTGRPDILALDNGYFLPLTLKNINTSTLEVELNSCEASTIDCIKLDTQGSELLILQGLDEMRFEKLLFVEAEVSLQSPTLYEGAATISTFQAFLEPKGFELANIRLSRDHSKNIQNNLPRPPECDVLFVRPFHLLGELKSNPQIISKLLLLSNMYYIYDYADELLEYSKNLDMSLFKSLFSCQNHIRSLQSKYLENGGLSLWHQDSA